MERDARAALGPRRPDTESEEWLRVLDPSADDHEQGLSRLHEKLVLVARHETRRRAAGGPVGGRELEDLAYQAAGDAMLAILAKLTTFRGESRFTTWAYAFVMFEVSSKLGRHSWRQASEPLGEEHWERLPDRLGVDPQAWSEVLEISLVVREAVDRSLTEHQRSVFVAIVLDGVPLDALADRLGTTRGALYKTVFDARRKIRAALVANGYLADDPRPPHEGRGLS